MSDLDPTSQSVLDELVAMTGSTWSALTDFPARGALVINLVDLVPRLEHITSVAERREAWWALVLESGEAGSSVLDDLHAFGHALQTSASARSRGSHLSWHGWLGAATALASAVAHPQTHVDTEVHQALLAAALSWRAKQSESVARSLSYRVGLHLRQLTERGQSEPSYGGPDDLATLSTFAAIAERLPRGAVRDTRPDGQIFRSTTSAHHNALVALGAIWQERHGQGRDQLRGVAKRGAGTRGENGSSLLYEYAAQTSEDLFDASLPDTRDEPSPSRTITHGPAIAAHVLDDDLKELTLRAAQDWASVTPSHDALPDRVQQWHHASVRIEERVAENAASPERRQALSRAIHQTLATNLLPSLEDEALLLLEGQDGGRAQRAALGSAPIWWQELASLSDANLDQAGDATASLSHHDAAKERLGLILCSVAGVPLRGLGETGLCNPNNSTKPGLRIVRNATGMHATMLWRLEVDHDPFTPDQCDPTLTHKASPYVELPLLPAIAVRVAELWEVLGAHWQDHGEGRGTLTAPRKPSLGLTSALRSLAERIGKRHRGRRAAAEQANGFYLAALAREGTVDPALAYALGPTLLRRHPPVASVYTNVPLSHLAAIYLRTQACAWQALCGERELVEPSVNAPEPRVGSQRCLTTPAVCEAHRVLERAARRGRRCDATSEQEVAEALNAQVRLVVFRLMVSRGLRARQTAWLDPYALQRGLKFWTFIDKGHYRRSLPLDAVDHQDIEQLAQMLGWAARHPRLGDVGVQLQDAVDALDHAARRHASRHRVGPLGQLQLVHRHWVWRPLSMHDLTTALHRLGVRIALAGIRHSARSVLVLANHAAAPIDSLFGHFGWGAEDFRPCRHHSGPLLTESVMPLIHTLRSTFGLPTDVTR